MQIPFLGTSFFVFFFLKNHFFEVAQLEQRKPSSITVSPNPDFSAKILEMCFSSVV
jgi:hypothetical protein